MTTLALEKIIEEWEDRIEMAAKKGQTLFGDHTQFNVLNQLFERLALNRAMSVSELVSALNILENIKVETKSKPQYITLAESLKQSKFSTLSSYDIPTKTEDLPVSTDLNSPFYKFLVKNHNLLLQYYEHAYFHTLGELPISEVNYEESQFKESQAFYNLETTSQGLHLPDKATIVLDLARGGITIDDTVVKPTDSNNKVSDDPKILNAIQMFTNDSLDNPHSRASKILNFGGQSLEGTLLDEFSNTTVFTDSRKEKLVAGIVKGHINWFSELNEDTYQKDYYATIDLKILTCAYTPELVNEQDNEEPVKKGKLKKIQEDQEFFAIASDGSTLLTLLEANGGVELEKILIRGAKELSGETKDNIVPICEIKAKVKLEETHEGYMMKVVEFKSKYNTPDLESTKAHLASVISPFKV
jgi:hypothetical protein